MREIALGEKGRERPETLSLSVNRDRNIGSLLPERLFTMNNYSHNDSNID